LAIITSHGVVAAATPVAIDIDAHQIEAVHFKDEALQTFTITNVSSNAIQKVGLNLVVLSVEVADRVRLRKAGAVLTEYSLRATLDAPGDIDLLADKGKRLMLGPGESEAFRLALVGNEGHIYTCSLVATCKNVKTEAEARATSREFTVE